jgi:hypothetical protein
MTHVSNGSPAERRVHTRHVFARPGSNPLVATLGVCPRCALVYDLSHGGISLLTAEEPPPAGSVVPVWLPAPDGRPSCLLLVSLLYSVAEGRNLFRVGGPFLDEASAAAAGQYLPPARKPAAPRRLLAAAG